MAGTKVFHPNPDFSGKIVGVTFVNGEATAEGMALAYFRRHLSNGYQVGARGESAPEPELVEPEVVEAAVEDEVAVADIPGFPGKDATRSQLAEFAEGMGLETEGLTKAQIIDKVKAEAAK